MNRGPFIRKLIYLLLILALLVPLSYFSQPATVAVGDQPKGAGGDNAGGKLARMRAEYGISQANLGEIDPAGETIKLATLGLRGVAANLLWEKANTAKMKEDWE
ncbi:MAG: IRE (iron responsive element), partial [Candidatus Saccharimonadales bacterium]